MGCWSLGEQTRQCACQVVAIKGCVYASVYKAYAGEHKHCPGLFDVSRDQLAEALF
jgi:hypothetical protein